VGYFNDDADEAEDDEVRKWGDRKQREKQRDTTPLDSVVEFEKQHVPHSVSVTAIRNYQ